MTIDIQKLVEREERRIASVKRATSNPSLETRKKQSEAGKKSIITLNAMYTAQKRKEAAKKAWEKRKLAQ